MKLMVVDVVASSTAQNSANIPATSFNQPSAAIATKSMNSKLAATIKQKNHIDQVTCSTKKESRWIEYDPVRKLSAIARTAQKTKTTIRISQSISEVEISGCKQRTQRVLRSQRANDRSRRSKYRRWDRYWIWEMREVVSILSQRMYHPPRCKDEKDS